MMRIWLLPLLLMLSTPASADFGFSPEEMTERLNVAASDFGLRKRFASGGCSQDVRKACRVSGPAVVGTVMSDIGGNADGLVLIYDAKDGDPVDLMASMGVVMSVLSPELSKDERGATMVSMLGPVLKQQMKEARRTIGQIEYVFAASPVVGVTFTVDGSK